MSDDQRIVVIVEALVKFRCPEVLRQELAGQEAAAPILAAVNGWPEGGELLSHAGKMIARTREDKSRLALQRQGAGAVKHPVPKTGGQGCAVAAETLIRVTLQRPACIFQLIKQLRAVCRNQGQAVRCPGIEGSFAVPAHGQLIDTLARCHGDELLQAGRQLQQSADIFGSNRKQAFLKSPERAFDKA